MMTESPNDSSVLFNGFVDQVQKSGDTIIYTNQSSILEGTYVRKFEYVMRNDAELVDF